MPAAGEYIILSRPAFDSSAGLFGAIGIQPALSPPQNLSGSYTVVPTVREPLSSSVTATDLFAGAPVGLSLVLLPRDSVAFSAGSTAAAIGPGDTGSWGADRFGSGAALATVGRLRALIPSSVFIDRGTAPAAAPTMPLSAAADLTVLQGSGVLTVYQALRDAVTDPAATAARSVENYAIGDPASAALQDSLRLPMRISSSGYGYLNSSLTVFSDDFGSFSGVGQSFNGLLALNVAEPASLVMLVMGLAGLAIVRRRLPA
jgi:hypothetical protein